MSLFSKLRDRYYRHRLIPAAVQELHDKVTKYLPNDARILEAGAHMGYDTVGISKMWPKGKVYAFEPVPSMFAGLQTRTSALRNVFSYQLALGENPGSVDMYVSDGQSTGSSSILKPSKHLELYPGVTFDTKVTVQMKTLKDWAREERIDRIDLMWLDMQGYEVNALKGAAEMLSSVRVIFTELCTNELYQGLVTKEEYISFLNERGFDLVSIESDTDEITNGIFVNRKFPTSR